MIINNLSSHEVKKLVVRSCRKSFEEGKKFIDSASVAQHYGAKLHLVEGPIQNIKITTQLDLYTFKAILDAREGNQLKEEFFN